MSLGTQQRPLCQGQRNSTTNDTSAASDVADDSKFSQESPLSNAQHMVNVITSCNTIEPSKVEEQDPTGDSYSQAKINGIYGPASQDLVTIYERTRDSRSKQQRSSRLRESAQYNRTLLNVEWHKCFYNRLHVMDGMKGIMSKLSSIASLAGASDQFGESQELFRELQQRVSTLEAHSIQTKAMETSLEQQIDKLARADRDFIESLEPVLTAIGGPDHEIFYNDDQSSASDASAEVPFVLQQYFDMLGDVSNLQERSHDLEIDHIQELQQRDFLADQDQQLTVSDESFHGDHVSRRQTLLKKIEEAQISLQHSRNMCRANGLDPDTRDYVRSATRHSQSESTADSGGGSTPVLVQAHSIYSPREPPSWYDYNGRGPMIEATSPETGDKSHKEEAVTHWSDKVTVPSDQPPFIVRDVRKKNRSLSDSQINFYEQNHASQGPYF